MGTHQNGRYGPMKANKVDRSVAQDMLDAGLY